MKYNKEELEKLIIDEKLSYKEIGRRYNVSDVFIRKIAIKLGIILPKRKILPLNYKPHNYGTGKKVYCLYCKKEIIKTYYNRKFCDNKCFGNNKKEKHYEYYMNNQDEFCRENFSIRNFKDVFLKEQENKCAICKNDPIWNNKSLVFVLDHIDGNASNNKRENLRLVCPNCDSQLDTFKSKNKNSARKNRYFVQRNGKI